MKLIEGKELTEIHAAVTHVCDAAKDANEGLEYKNKITNALTHGNTVEYLKLVGGLMTIDRKPKKKVHFSRIRVLLMSHLTLTKELAENAKAKKSNLSDKQVQAIRESYFAIRKSLPTLTGKINNAYAVGMMRLNTRLDVFSRSNGVIRKAKKPYAKKVSSR